MPDSPNSARTNNAGINVVVDWDAPSFDGASPILGYRIKIKSADGLFLVESTACDGLGAD